MIQNKAYSMVYTVSVVGRVSPGGSDSVWDIRSKLIINSNLAKSRWLITFISVLQSFRNFAQITAVSLPCPVKTFTTHYSDVVMSAMASQITSLTNDYSTVYSGTDQRKHQSSASFAFVRGIHRWPVNSPHKGLVTRKLFPFDDVIMEWATEK